MNDVERQKLIDEVVGYWAKDWNRFAYDALGARLDREQRDVLDSVQYNKMTTVASGTARGKDYVAACASICFMYLTPTFDVNGVLSGNTKVAMTAPTGRQVSNIMTPEVRRLIRAARRKFPFCCPGRLVADDIRTDYEEWFLTGFKADDNATEAWSGFHAANTMFVVTEASGISDTVFNAIEGNLQGNSRLLLVFNPNITTGYAAESMKSDRFRKFRLDSLNAENVVKKQIVIPGQVDYVWVEDKVKKWCMPIRNEDYNEGEGDFKWDGITYRPNDLFRVKVRGMFPRVDEDVLIPYEWVTLAYGRWKAADKYRMSLRRRAKIGCDVAGMGRDSSVKCFRYVNWVSKFEARNSAGRADHMRIAGEIYHDLQMDITAHAYIDTIGEGAGVFSRLQELGMDRAISCKFSEGASGLHDETGEYSFANMRAYLFWCIRDWLNPANGQEAMLPEDDQLMEELTSTHWKFQSNGNIIIEPKEDIKERIKRSPDKMDALANTFYPYTPLSGDVVEDIEMDL